MKSSVLPPRRRVLCGFVLVVLLGLAGTERADAEAGVFEAFAHELLELIDKQNASPSGGVAPGRKVRIAIVPFDPARIPIAMAAADELNRSLLAELVRLSEDRHLFLPRRALSDIMRDMHETGALDDGAIAGLLSRAQDHDILVIGHMRLRPSARAIALSYQAVRKDVTTAAQTRVRTIDLASLDADPDRPVQTLGQALQDAIAYLRDHAHDMTELRLGGIRFEDSGMQPAFAWYLEERVSTALQAAFANVITDAKLVVRPAGLSAQQVERLRRTAIESKDLRLAQFEGRPGAYILTGSYWDFGSAIEIRLSLGDAAGAAVSWQGRVRPDSLPDAIALRPEANPGTAPLLYGPIGMTLTTDRGKSPSYRIGERLNLLIRADRELWLYCFYRQAEGGVIQIFPNPHAWDHSGPPRLEAGLLHTIPGETTYPFDFVLRAPAGIEQVTCFATSRDVTGELPEVLQGRSFDPLPAWAERSLSRTFAKLRNAAVSQNDLVITVRP